MRQIPNILPPVKHLTLNLRTCRLGSDGLGNRSSGIPDGARFCFIRDSLIWDVPRGNGSPRLKEAIRTLKKAVTGIGQILGGIEVFLRRTIQVNGVSVSGSQRDRTLSQLISIL